MHKQRALLLLVHFVYILSFLAIPFPFHNFLSRQIAAAYNKFISEIVTRVVWREKGWFILTSENMVKIWLILGPPFDTWSSKSGIYFQMKYLDASFSRR